jgi:hypothetical protein
LIEVEKIYWDFDQIPLVCLSEFVKNFLDGVLWNRMKTLFSSKLNLRQRFLKRRNKTDQDTLKKVKELCKGFGFTVETLKGERNNEEVYARTFFS